MPCLSLRIYLDPGGRIGPGKIELLEKIGSLGSISAAGRAMGMSYRRAWELVEETNRIFGKPVATRQIGGRHAARPHPRRPLPRDRNRHRRGHPGRYRGAPAGGGSRPGVIRRPLAITCPCRYGAPGITNITSR